MAQLDQILVYDTTMRDGEQAPGFSMTPEDKLALGCQLEQLGVDIIEVGFPSSSADDLEASRQLAAKLTRSQVSVMGRAIPADIDVCVEALRPTDNGRIHVFTATSELHIREKLRTTPERNIEDTRAAVRYARDRCPDVQFGCEDATRSDVDYLCRIVEACIDAGASTVDIADTVGYMTPAEFGELIGALLNRVPNIDRATISVHCHDDLGLAVANSLAGLQAGARQVDCTVNGIGERAGNASLEEIVMCLATRGGVYGLRTGITTSLLYPTSRLLTEITGVDVQPNKAIVGANAFSHGSGIHQHGLLANAATYEVMAPAVVGAPARRLVLGKHAGKRALRSRLADMNIHVPEERLGELLRLLKERAGKESLPDAAVAALARSLLTTQKGGDRSA